MTFVSHAQNFEDVILWRALKHVQHGCYIDVGAQDPVTDSVSLAFYENGWRGVHVEPVAAYAAKLRDARPDETVIEAAVGVGDAATTLYAFEGTGLTTHLKEYAEKHRRGGHDFRRIEVPTRTLASIFAEIGDRDIHWLKIDVEGMERQVLQSWSGSGARPWIVVIESTVPNQQIDNSDTWQDLVSALDYECAYFDGLNRFFVHNDHKELIRAFGPGPNYYDEFSITRESPFAGALRHDLEQQSTRIAELTSEKLALDAALHEAGQRNAKLISEKLALDAALHEAGQRNAKLITEIGSLLQAASEAAGRLDAVYASTSWRLTAPLRLVGNAVRARRVFRGSLRAGASAGLTLVRHLPALKKPVWMLASLHPPLKRKLVNFATARAYSRAMQDAGPSAAGGALASRWRVRPASSRQSRRFISRPGEPLLSICVTTYNRAKYLEFCLQAIFERVAGKESRIEVVVCDNASTDNTEEVARSFHSKANFKYYRNSCNVGMLGNLGVTANHATGRFVWIIGDDDIILPGAIEAVLAAIEQNPTLEFIYTNYSYTHKEIGDVSDVNDLLSEQTAISPPGENRFVQRLRDVAANSENFFTAIYCCIFRNDHARAAYNQDTSGDPFTTLLTCVPSTVFVLEHLLDRPAYWIGTPAILVNMNVSWLRYADLWVLERFPEMYQRFEDKGIALNAVDIYRKRSVPGVVHHLRQAITEGSPNLPNITLRRLLRTYKHLPEFQACLPQVNALLDEAERKNISFDRSALVRPLETAVRVEGPFVGSYSLALVNRNIAAALAQAGCEVTIGPSPTEGQSFSLSQAQVDPATWDLYRKAPASCKPGCVLRYTYPFLTDGMSANTNIYHSVGWEESGFPIDAIERFNALDGVTTMSRYTKKILIDHGLTVPVRVTGIGVDHLPHTTGHKPARAGRPFTFLHVSSCFPRKGVDVLIRAFIDAFSSCDDVRLVIKTFPNPHNTVEQLVAAMRGGRHSTPHIDIINEDWNEPAKVAALYSAADVLVAPSRGEGFCLPIAEALCAGIPVIATGHGGITDMLDADYPWQIDYHFEYSQTHLRLPGSYWAEPNAADLARLLRMAFQSTDEERKEIAKTWCTKIESTHKWSHVARRIVDFIDDVCTGTASAVSSRPARDKLLHITTWNSICGIAEYSRELSCEFPLDRLHVFASRLGHGVEPTRSDESYVTRNWDCHETSELTAAIEAFPGLATILIQFQPSFFSVAQLARLASTAIKRDANVLIVLHNTLAFTSTLVDEDIDTFSDFRLRLCVHSVNDLNYLKARAPELLPNATMVPHGMIVTTTERPHRGPDRPFTVSSFGFLLPHKGIVELINGFAQVHRRRPNTRLKLLTCTLDQRSEDYAERCRNEINRLGIKDAVEMTTSYLPKEEIITRLSTADLIVLAYQSTTESASGAARTCLSSGTPVLCSPSPIFSDVADVVQVLASANPADIADSIEALMDDPEALRAAAERQREWMLHSDWHRLSRRLLAMMSTVRD